MNTKLSCFSSGLCLLLISLASCVAAPESTPESNETTSDLATTSEKMSAEFPHCVIEAVSVPDDRKVVPSSSPAPTCFRSYSEATTFATKGRVTLPKDASLEEVNDAITNEEKNGFGAQSVVIAREYMNAGFSYPSLAVTASSGCGNGNRLYATMPAGWNDVISSALIYGGTGCFHAYHYEHANFGGASLDTADGRGNMGSMNDRTSSILWTR